jgi:hypothetical protein
MLGFGFVLGWLAFEFVILDLLDKRYNQKSTIKLLPSIDISWTNKSESLILFASFAWLNLEFSIIAFDMDYYRDSLEELIEDYLEEEDKDKK